MALCLAALPTPLSSLSTATGYTLCSACVGNSHMDVTMYYLAHPSLYVVASLPSFGHFNACARSVRLFIMLSAYCAAAGSQALTIALTGTHPEPSFCVDAFLSVPKRGQIYISTHVPYTRIAPAKVIIAFRTARIHSQTPSSVSALASFSLCSASSPLRSDK